METDATTDRKPEARRARFPYRRVMIAAWDGQLPARLIDYATDCFDAGALFHVVAVAPPDDDDPASSARLRCEASNMMQAACSLLTARGLHAGSQLLTLSRAWASSAWLLADAASHWGADLVLTSCAGPAHLARAAHCPVLVLPDAESAHHDVPPHRFFVASDDSDASRLSIDEAARLMQPGDDLRVARVVLDPACAPPANTVDSVVLWAAGHGSLAHSIIGAALAWRADLLVLGTHAGQPSGKWRFASIAEQVAQLGALPLLLVPAGARC
jgi:nucleotide-binding universal stress UspA family protein